MLDNKVNITSYSAIDASQLSIRSSIEEIIYSITGLMAVPVTLSEKGMIGFVDGDGNIIARFDKVKNSLEVYSDDIGYVINNIVQEDDSDIKILQKIFKVSFETTKIPQDDGSIIFVDSNRNTLAIKTADGDFHVLNPDGSIEAYNSQGEPLLDSESCASAVYDAGKSEITQNSAKRFSNNSKVYVDPLTDPVMQLFQMSFEVRINENGEREYFDAFGVKVATLFEDGRIAIYLTDGSVEYYASNGKPLGAEIATMSCSMSAENFEEENYQPSLMKNTPEPKNEEQKQGASTVAQGTSNESTKSEEVNVTNSDDSVPIGGDSTVTDLNKEVSDNVDNKNETIGAKIENASAILLNNDGKQISISNDPFVLVLHSDNLSSSQTQTSASMGPLSIETNPSIVIYNSNKSVLPESVVLKQLVLAQIIVSTDGAMNCCPINQDEGFKPTLNNVNTNFVNLGMTVFINHNDVQSVDLDEKSARIFTRFSGNKSTKISNSSAKPVINFGNDSIDQNPDMVVVILGAPPWMMQVNKDCLMMLASSDAPKSSEGEKVASAEDRSHGRNQQRGDEEGRRGNKEEYVVVDDNDEEDFASLV